MASVSLLWKGVREVIGKRAEMPVLVTDVADEAAARAALEVGIGGDYGGLTLDEIELGERLSETTWRALARYTAPDDSAVLKSQYDFDTIGGTHHITQNLSTLGKYGPLASLPEKGAIGFDGQNVQGVDIVVPKFEWGETQYMYWVPASGEWTYMQMLMALTGRVNDAEFRGFAAGEVLFRGAHGQRTGGLYNYWKIDFRFAASPNQTGITIGDIEDIEKPGWAYMDVRYSDALAEATATGEEEDSLVIPVPVAVLVHQVYEAGDFSELNLVEP